MYSDLKEILNTDNLEIYKPYSYKYFVEKYPMRYDNMFKKYYDKLKKKYDYFVTFPMISEKPFYVKGTLENILKYIDKNKWEYTEILNCNWDNYYQDIYKYCYFNNKEEGFLCEDFRNQYGEILYKNPNKNITWRKYFYDESLKRLVYYRFENDIGFWKDSYEITYDSKNKQWKVHKWIAFSSGKDVPFDDTFKDYIEKIVKKMNNKKYEDFYKEDVKLICELLGFNEKLL